MDDHPGGHQAVQRVADIAVVQRLDAAAVDLAGAAGEKVLRAEGDGFALARRGAVGQGVVGERRTGVYR